MTFLLLSACDTGAWKRQEDLMARGWAEAPEPYTPAQLYCYRTLAGNECFRAPLEGQEDRLDGYYTGITHPEAHAETTVNVAASKTFLKTYPKELPPLVSKRKKSPPKSLKSSQVEKIKPSVTAEKIKDDEKYQRKRFMTRIIQE